MTTAPWPPAGCVYGVDVARFQDSDGDGVGDLAGLIDRLDHIAALGASWIWLLPVYPSLRRDNGYDVDDHENVDPRFGDLDDFSAVVDACHARGLSVMIDLIVHHTSERHRWFQQARRNRDSRHGDYYVWADEPIDDPGDVNVFPGEEDGVWTHDDAAGAWYHHQFYRYQPDLNLANPEVFEELVRIAALWLRRGVDGFRIDAAIPAVREKPTAGTEVDERALYDRLRERLTAVLQDVVLVAEADVPPEAMRTLADDHRMDAVLDFTLDNALFLALAREDASPLRGALARLDGDVPPSARLNFVRNVDELDLDQLDEAEREQVFEVFGTSPSAFLYGRGLRRGWAPMMGTVERYRMTLSLLMALPGVPLLMHGQELGIGDDLSVSGRDACRPVMQWTDGPGGGFTSHPDAPLILPAQRSGPFDFAHVNAAAQRDDPDSVLALVRRLNALRGEAGVQVQPAEGVPLPETPAVLAMRGDGILTLHNLGSAPQRVGLPDAASAEVLLAEGWHDSVLAPSGFAWLRTSTARRRG